MRLKVENKMQESAVAELKAKLEANEVSKSACVKALFNGGLSVKEIVAATGIKYNHAYNVVRNEIIVNDLDVINEGRSASDSKKSQILKLLAEGKTITEVSKELKCMYNYVWQIARAAAMDKKNNTNAKVAEA